MCWWPRGSLSVDHLEVDGEDSVGPGGVRVHGGSGGHPVGDALLEQHCHLGYTVHHVNCQAIHSVLLQTNVRFINYSIISFHSV